MQKRRLLLVVSLLFLIFSKNSYAQFNLSGTVADSVTGKLDGVLVKLFLPKDTTAIAQNLTNDEGFFTFTNLKKERYLLKIQVPSYKDTVQSIDLNKSIDLKTIFLTPSVLLLKSVEISATLERVVQNGDTTEFNAEAFKVSDNAMVDRLLKKLPGIQIIGGVIKADGKDVSKILVDGKPFFSGSDEETLKKLPAAAVEKVQVYEEKTEQAKFTGIEDGELEKTINIVTKPSFRNSLFGDAFAGIGYPSNYNAGFVVNSFRNDEKITANAKFENKHQGHLVQDNASAGINYVNKIGKWDISGSYNFNYSNNENQYKTNRLYLTKQTEGLKYNELQNSKANSFSNTFSFDFKWTIDTMNTFYFRPKVSFRQNESESTLAAENLLFDTIINATKTNNGKKTNIASYSFPMNYNHSFVKKGRSLSVDFNPQINLSPGDGGQKAVYSYYDTINRIDLLNTNYTSNQDQYSLLGGISYSEPLVKEKLFLQLSYRANYDANTSNKTTNDVEQTGVSNIDTALSSKFNDKTFTNSGSMGLRFNSKKIDISLRGVLTYKQQSNNETFPVSKTFAQSYLNFLPNLWMNLRVNEKNRIQMYISSYAKNPSSRQMQEVIDNSNPLQLYSGNSQLNQSINNNIWLSYSYTKPSSSISFRTSFSGTYTLNPIGTSTIIASATDTLPNGIILQPGAQYTTPINFNNSYYQWGNMNFSIPLKWIKCNLSASLDNNFSYSQSKINDNDNKTYNNSLSPSLRLSSNISEKIDFNVFGSFGYNTVSNTIQKELNSSYTSWGAGFRLELEPLERLFFNTDLNWWYYSSFGIAGKDQENTRWNASIGYKLLKKKQFVLTVSIYDILAQDVDFTRNIREAYYEEVHKDIFSRYVMVELKWKFTTFKDGKTPEIQRREKFMYF